MSRRARLFAGALSLLALLALTAAGIATASSPPPGTPLNGTKPGKITKVGQSNPAPSAPRAANVIGYRLTAKLAPAGNAPAAATGHWDGVLVHIVGVVKNGPLPSVPGCVVTRLRPGGPAPQPPRRSGMPARIKCVPNGAVPPFTVPGSGDHWVLGWRLTFDHLSSAVTSADIHITVPTGLAPVSAANLCGTCVSGKLGRTTLTDDQANAILKGEGSVLVSTAKNPSGELSGQIVRVKPTAAVTPK